MLKLMGNQEYFDLASLVQLTEETRDTIRMQLHRWINAGKLLKLRRGMYAFSENYRKRPLSPPELANRIYTPSYLSTYWASGYFGLIPEKVVIYTSITTRTPKIFKNDIGVFQYQHLKPEAFFGYRPMEMDGRKILAAEPEKSLLDLWYLSRGTWDRNRMDEMRFQNVELIDGVKLREYAARFTSPRLLRAANLWVELTIKEREGTVDL